MLFSAHAAAAIANAGAYREERRARAYLETLVETSPVGDVPRRRVQHAKSFGLVHEPAYRDVNWKLA